MNEQKLLPQVGIFVFDGVELLDYAGPAEVLSIAKPVGETTPQQKLFSVVTIGETTEPVKPSSGAKIIPDYDVQTHPPLDILILPGGLGTRDTERRRRLVPWILVQNDTTDITASVCTGAFFLAEADLLRGRRATTHWNGKQWIAENHPEVELVKENNRYVDEGHIVTSAGISAGIDMAFHLVERIYGEETAQWTAHLMEYDWQPRR